MLTLTVSHNIYLTREQRYQLNNGENIEVTGVSVPVWFRKGDTTEPAKEVFATYKIKNKKSKQAVKEIKKGYELNFTDYSSLLDVKDGGSEWFEFNHQGSAAYEDSEIVVLDFVEIKPIELLLETMT